MADVREVWVSAVGLGTVRGMNGDVAMRGYLFEVPMACDAGRGGGLVVGASEGQRVVDLLVAAGVPVVAMDPAKVPDLRGLSEPT